MTFGIWYQHPAGSFSSLASESTGLMPSFNTQAWIQPTFLPIFPVFHSQLKESEEVFTNSLVSSAIETVHTVFVKENKLVTKAKHVLNVGQRILCVVMNAIQICWKAILWLLNIWKFRNHFLICRAFRQLLHVKIGVHGQHSTCTERVNSEYSALLQGYIRKQGHYPNRALKGEPSANPFIRVTDGQCWSELDPTECTTLTRPQPVRKNGHTVLHNSSAAAQNPWGGFS